MLVRDQVRIDGFLYAGRILNFLEAVSGSIKALSSMNVTLVLTFQPPVYHSATVVPFSTHSRLTTLLAATTEDVLSVALLLRVRLPGRPCPRALVGTAALPIGGTLPMGWSRRLMTEPRTEGQIPL